MLGMATARVIGGRSIEQNSGFNLLEFEIELDEAAAGSLTVPYRVTFGTALEQTDYIGFNALVGEVTFDAGETRQTVTVRSVGDAELELDESVVLEIFPSPAVDLPGGVTRSAAPFWILDDDGSPNPLAIWASSPTVLEGDGRLSSVLFELSLSRPADDDIEIPYSLVADSAGADDVVLESGTISIPTDADDAVLRVEIRGDEVPEGIEYADLVLDLPPAIQSAHGGRLTIIDDDVSPFPTVTASPVAKFEANSGFRTLAFDVALSEPATAPVSIDYRIEDGTAQEGPDYISFDRLSGTVDFEAGESSQTVTMRSVGESVIEPDEGFLLVLDAPRGPAILPGAAPRLETVAWILDDDGDPRPLAASASSPVIAERDDGSSVAYFDVELSRPAPTDISFRYQTRDGTAEAGEDYEEAVGSVAIAEGKTAATVGVEILGDTRFEDGETFSLRLSRGDDLGQTFGGSATIANDDSTTERWVQRGTSGNDEIAGYEFRDDIKGRDGNDRLFGFEDKDRLDGGDGRDKLFGGDGKDRLKGGDGNDVLKGQDGKDRLFGEEGDDKLKGGGGRDKLEGGAGDDRLKGGGEKDTFIFGADDGSDRIKGFQDGTDVIEITEGASRFSDLEIEDAGRNVVIRFANTTIELVKENFGDIDAGDFDFG